MSSQLSAQWAEPPWGAEPRFELGPALQQASALPTKPRCTLFTDYFYGFTSPRPPFSFYPDFVSFSSNVSAFRHVISSGLADRKRKSFIGIFLIP
jgi:hypothetical protein